jgi:hypothetical protein
MPAGGHHRVVGGTVGELSLPPSTGEVVQVVPPSSLRQKNSLTTSWSCATANRRLGSAGSTARCGSDGFIPAGTASIVVATRG